MKVNENVILCLLNIFGIVFEVYEVLFINYFSYDFFS